MTPEGKLRQHLASTLKRILPKGRYVLQPIETYQVGVPDFYFCFNSHSMWIETKTTDYVVDRFQRNWAVCHANAGGKTLLVTHLPSHLPYPQQPHTTIPYQAHTPQYSSAPSHLYLLQFNSKMLDYSSLGTYIRKEHPQMIALEDYLQGLQT